MPYLDHYKTMDSQLGVVEEALKSRIENATNGSGSGIPNPNLPHWQKLLPWVQTTRSSQKTTQSATTTVLDTCLGPGNFQSHFARMNSSSRGGGTNPCAELLTSLTTAFLGDYLKEIANSVDEFTKELMSHIDGVLGPIMGALEDLQDMVDEAWGMVEDAIGKLQGTISGMFGQLMPWLNAIGALATTLAIQCLADATGNDDVLAMMQIINPDGRQAMMAASDAQAQSENPATAYKIAAGQLNEDYNPSSIMEGWDKSFKEATQSMKDVTPKVRARRVRGIVSHV